jgi:hypothetical protein
MPLNLAESALSVVKLGENTLSAIYAGETRVYPNQVQISIDGGQIQTGEPGDSIAAPLTYSVTPSNQSTKHWTAAQISAATLTGLPSGWTATFSASGDFGLQTGTYSITTTNGLFPATDTDILTSSLTSTIAETNWGTVQVTVNRSGGFGTGTTNLTFKNFVGSSAGTTVDGTDTTRVGRYVNPAYNTPGGLTNNSGVTCTGSFNTSPHFSRRHSVNCTIPSTGISSSNVTLTSTNSVNAAPLMYEVPSFGVNAPPWQSPTGAALFSLTQCWYIGKTNSSLVDPRLRMRLKYSNVTGSSDVKYTTELFPNNNFNGTASLPPNGSWQSRYIYASNFSGRANSGYFTVTLESNYFEFNTSTYNTVSNSNSNWPISATGQYTV